jgi:hypothetical protein
LNVEGYGRYDEEEYMSRNERIGEDLVEVDVEV